MKRRIALGVVLCVLGGAVDVAAEAFKVEYKKGQFLCDDFDDVSLTSIPTPNTFYVFDGRDRLIKSANRFDLMDGSWFRLTAYFLSPTRMEFIAIISEEVIPTARNPLFNVDKLTEAIVGHMTFDDRGDAVSIKGRTFTVGAFGPNGEECMKYAKFKSVERIE